MYRIRLAFVTLAVVGGLLPALPISAQTSANLACLSVPDSGFADVPPTSVHKRDIDCVAARGIAMGTGPGIYSPEGLVPRWQMAVFLTRMFAVLPDGAGGVFNDVAALPLETQFAINQLKRLGVTAGTTPGTFDPITTVPRWQMATFIIRVLTRYGVSLPDGSSQGFADVSDLSVEARTAINQARQLGIATGTSSSTFDPFSPVRRDQMASFLARALNVIRSIGQLNTLLVCDPARADVIGSIDPATFPAGQSFTIRQGWAQADPALMPGQAVNFTSGFELSLDGATVPLSTTVVVMEGIAYQMFGATFADGLTGIHSFEYRWICGGRVQLKLTMTATFEA
jgi:hypothetical protein